MCLCAGTCTEMQVPDMLEPPFTDPCRSNLQGTHCGQWGCKKKAIIAFWSVVATTTDLHIVLHDLPLCLNHSDSSCMLFSGKCWTEWWCSYMALLWLEFFQRWFCHKNPSLAWVILTWNCLTAIVEALPFGFSFLSISWSEVSLDILWQHFAGISTLKSLTHLFLLWTLPLREPGHMK